MNTPLSEVRYTVQPCLKGGSIGWRYLDRWTGKFGPAYDTHESALRSIPRESLGSGKA